MFPISPDDTPHLTVILPWQRTLSDDHAPRAPCFQGIFRPFRTHFDVKWCPGAESNHRHEDFQSTALPLSYPGIGKRARFGWRRLRRGSGRCPEPIWSGQCRSRRRTAGQMRPAPPPPIPAAQPDCRAGDHYTGSYRPGPSRGRPRRRDPLGKPPQTGKGSRTGADPPQHQLSSALRAAHPSRPRTALHRRPFRWPQ